MRLGTIKNLTVEKNADSDNKVRLLACEVSSPDDVEDVELIHESGVDTNPSAEDVVVILSINEAYSIGILVDDGIEPDETIESGEKEIYSSDGGARKAKLRFKKDGDLVLNDGADFAVAFDKLKAKIDTLETRLLAHVHGGVTAGGALTGTTTTAAFIDIDDSKVEKVRLPS